MEFWCLRSPCTCLAPEMMKFHRKTYGILSPQIPKHMLGTCDGEVPWENSQMVGLPNLVRETCRRSRRGVSRWDRRPATCPDSQQGLKLGPKV